VDQVTQEIAERIRNEIRSILNALVEKKELHWRLDLARTCGRSPILSVLGSVASWLPRGCRQRR
jgi:hypothetical protein